MSIVVMKRGWVFFLPWVVCAQDIPSPMHTPAAVVTTTALSSKSQPSIPPAPDCLAEAAAFHQVNDWVLRAIIWQESRNQPMTINKNSNGSVDVGLGGINSVHFAELYRYGIAPRDLLDHCTNLYVSAWHLQRQIKKWGNNWVGVGAYHSTNPVHNATYSATIRGILVSWGILPK
jgi:hypothetical protein